MIILVAWLVIMAFAMVGCLVADKWDWIGVIAEDWSEDKC
jgi:hypothetical protein